MTSYQGCIVLLKNIFLIQFTVRQSKMILDKTITFI